MRKKFQRISYGVKTRRQNTSHGILLSLHAAANRIRSLCIAMNRPECNYSFRMPMPAKNSSSDAASRLERKGVSYTASSPSRPTGRTFLQKDEERTAMGDRVDAGHMALPLKRCERQTCLCSTAGRSTWPSNHWFGGWGVVGMMEKFALLLHFAYLWAIHTTFDPCVP